MGPLFLAPGTVPTPQSSEARQDVLFIPRPTPAIDSLFAFDVRVRLRTGERQNGRLGKDSPGPPRTP